MTSDRINWEAERIDWEAEYAFAGWGRSDASYRGVPWSRVETAQRRIADSQRAAREARRQEETR